jgi:Transcriptional regulator, AbiEi antitoxin
MHVDAILSALASDQQAIVKREQLVQAGLSVAAIDHWVRRGRLHIRHRGVYALGHTALPEFSDEMAAVMACQPRALLSHASAAHVWGFGPKPATGKVDVTVVGRNVRDRPGIQVHRTNSLMRVDARVQHKIPITSPARTVFDLASTIREDRDLELALHEAIALKVLTIPEVKAVLARYPNRPGSARLAELIHPTRGLTVTDSRGAERLLRHLRRSGMPHPLVDVKLGRWRADFYWPRQTWWSSSTASTSTARG